VAVDVVAEENNMEAIQSFYTIIVAIITVLGSAGAWRYYEKKAQLKKEEDDFIRDDCRDRIIKLEALLERSSNEKDELRESVLQLTKEVAALHVKVEFLEKENRRLLESRK
jgi:alanine-alpha-ketoisovalerate/valine-pyruvate aminotransferase